MIKKVALLTLNVLLLGVVAFSAYRLRVLEQGYVPAGRAVKFALSRGTFTAHEFKPSAAPRAVIFFGSGDGGWGPWEDSVADALQRAGYEVIGIDSAAYAATPYDLPTLQRDFSSMVKAIFSHLGSNPPPFIVGGWSMGAGQAIAVAGGPNPPPHLRGLLLASPLSRGRFGLNLEDKLNVLPTGPGTFAVRDFERKLKGLRVVQWHAANDSIDSRAWLTELRAPHLEHDFPNAGHTYDGADDAFRRSFVSSVSWILQDSPSSEKGGGTSWPTQTARSAP